MPRGRPPKNKKTEQELSEVENYQMEFAKSFLNAMNNAYFYDNPYLKNEILKNINMTPHKLDRDEVERLIANPRANEKAIRDLAQYLENYIMHFKRIVHYYGTILTFDYYLQPSNADEEDMKSTAYKKSWNKAFDWLDKFNVKQTFTNVLKAVMLEETKYYYVRESDAGIALQEMPSDWCMITAKTDFGYAYSINMMYFLQTGINLDDYAPEFREYFNEFTATDEYNKGFPFWKDLDPLKAPVFKFDENHAGVVPPLMALFIDSIEIATYKNLIKTKTKLESWKILLSKIPLHSGDKGAKKMNDFAIDATEAGKFNAIIQSAIPEGTQSIVTPFDTEAINFDQAQSKNSIVGIGEQQFYSAAGSNASLFGESNTNASGIAASIKTDESFVMHMYRQFERFLNNQLKSKTGRYRFKVVFPDITIFNRSDKIDECLNVSQYGFPVSKLVCALGMNQRELVNLLDFEDSLGIYERLKPLISSHTMNGNNDGGRPQLKDSQVSDNTEIGRDNGANDNR